VKDKNLIRDCYFKTDYDQSLEHLAQAKALLRAGEWDYAKREFMQVFKLFRGEPFRKMYDDWSDDKRLEVLFGYETEVLTFAKELLKRGRKEEARRLLRKAHKIIPDSEEIESLLN
jgi:Flp pilus assembly protein TadD